MIGFAQDGANLIVHADDSTVFILFVDGIQQLDSAWYSIKVTGIEDQSHSVQIKLPDQKDTLLEKPIYFQNLNVESTMKLTQQNGIFKLRYFGEVSMGAAPILEDQVVCEFKSKGMKSISTNSNIAEMTKVEAYSYEYQNGTNHYSLSNEPNYIANQPSVDQVEITTNATMEADLIEVDSLNPMLDSSKNYSSEILEVIYNYKGEKGCTVPDFELNQLLSQINDSPFSNQKIKLAKNGVKDQCLATFQVERIANTLAFEDEKLSFIKFCYPFVYDRDNYKKLLSLFNIEQTRNDFINFLNS